MIKKPEKRKLCAALGLFAAFILWTAAVSLIDVRPIGPRGSAVGLAAFNGFVHKLTGVHMSLYVLTDWLGLVPLCTAFGFALLGLVQWVARKHVLKVDRSLLVLGGFYLAVLAVYLFFEVYAVNYRPVLIESVLEVSYPSSTTVLVLTVMAAAALQLRVRIGRPVLRRITVSGIGLFAAFVVVGRFVSGVHWASDIIGGILISAAFVTVYSALSE